MAAAPSYISETHLGLRSLGGHFTFNDFVGVGTYIGPEREWSLGWSWRHISNLGIYEPNMGIDIPFYVVLGRRF